MRIKVNMFIAVLITFCLASVFMAIPTESQTTTKTYNPLADINEDGKVSLADLTALAMAYGTSGTPINITALQTDITTLQSEIDSLNTSLTNLENTVATQQSAINNLGAQLATKLGAPDYDSGWVGIAQGEAFMLTDNLGTTNVLVYMTGNGQYGVAQFGYGGIYWSNAYNAGYGAYWYDLTPNAIIIYRLPQDYWFAAVRVQMWILP